MTLDINCAEMVIFHFHCATMASLPSKSANGRDSDTSTVSSHFLTSNSTNDASQSLKDGETSENHGLKRKARELSPSNKKEEPCMFAELPDDVSPLILLNLVHKDRLSVALTGKDSLKKVESLLGTKVAGVASDGRFDVGGPNSR